MTEFSHGKELKFFRRQFLSLKHSVNLKNHIYKSKNVRSPTGTMYNSTLFISKLSLVTVGFLVRNGFGVYHTEKMVLLRQQY